MLKNPSPKYQAFPPVQLPDRTWPNRTITAPPVWMSTDLRDGNQALFEPMDAERKLRMFQTLVGIGLKQIEVAFPSASQTDFDFVRRLIEEKLIPDDVTIEVLTQAREDLIRRTFESLRGAPRAIVHLYSATAPAWRRIVFNLEQPEVKAMAVRATTLMRQLADAQPETDWTFEYSPETFMATELPFAREVCDAVVDAWGGTPEKPVIINLPTTVEVSTPNVFADQIEWMHRNLTRRDAIILSVHPHNDRGTAVAAAELAVMAGAQRVEGCLFGNGERTGNVDLVTLALNLYTQGVHPGLDFSSINEIARVAEDCTQLPVHPRHPYAGDLVFTAFSGSHQDAIKKGFAAQDPHGVWEVPYLPIDPADLGRSYDSVVRVNSQSGKGGIAFLLENHHGISMPRRMQVEFSGVVQRETDAEGGEFTADRLWTLFEREYLASPDGAAQDWVLRGHRSDDGADGTHVVLEVTHRGHAMTLRGQGNGPVSAAVDAFNRSGLLHGELRVDDFHEHAQTAGAQATALTLIEVAIGKAPPTFGAGRDVHIVAAAMQALVQGVNRLVRRDAVKVAA
jgi:2-isopropylmalate synthase